MGPSCVVKVVIVGEKRIAESVEAALHAGGFDASPTYPTGAVSHLARNENQLCVLVSTDLVPARKFLDDARVHEVRAPIIVVTDSPPGATLRRGLLSEGAIDVLSVDRIEKLLSRVGDLARNVAASTDEHRSGAAIEIDDLRIDPSSVEAYVAGIPVGLNLTEFRIVSHLARAPGHALLREQLFEAIWGRRQRREGRDQTLKSQVRLIRAKFAATAPGRTYIHVRRTAFGVVYAIEPGGEVAAGTRPLKSRTTKASEAEVDSG